MEFDICGREGKEAVLEPISHEYKEMTIFPILHKLFWRGEHKGERGMAQLGPKLLKLTITAFQFQKSLVLSIWLSSRNYV